MISPYLRLAWNSGTSKSSQLLPAFDADIMAAFETKLEQEMPGLMLKMWQPKIGGREKELDKLSLFLEILNELRVIQWCASATGPTRDDPKPKSEPRRLIILISKIVRWLGQLYAGRNS